MLSYVTLYSLLYSILSAIHYSTILYYAILCYMYYYGWTAGAVFGNTPHIVQVDEFSDLFAFRLIEEGPSYILAFKNQDRPGAISEVLLYCTN